VVGSPLVSVGQCTIIIQTLRIYVCNMMGTCGGFNTVLNAEAEGITEAQQHFGWDCG
jgi:hypothetical protein